MLKINVLSPQEHPYLKILSSIAKCPDTLHFVGTLPASRQVTLAVVGTRKPTTYGKEVTSRIVAELAQKGVVIVSGLALGIDAIAHGAALEAHGTTIAVLANALPAIRPLSNRSLGERIIAQGGAIIAEHATDEKFGPWSFLERNRLVAGISDAVLITEASAKSGTLNTAMHALEQGKDVFVVPGNITSPLSAGCNALIKQGAHPVTCSDDILEILAPELLSAPAHQILTYSPTEQLIIEQLQNGVHDGELIQRQTGLDAASLSTALSMLEVNGTIRSLGANQWTVL